MTNQATGEVTTFTYDGNGARVQKDVDGTITTYVGGYYEVQGSVETSYYYAAGQRVAMRKDGEVTYLHSDHLGSTSLTTNDAGGFEARVLYYPYGEERYDEGTLQTDYQFTGQRREGFGLYDYQARFYDPYLGRFVSADTIVPDPASPQSLNRFAYVYNNPLKYSDPTGHCSDGDTECEYQVCNSGNDPEVCAVQTGGGGGGGGERARGPVIDGIVPIPGWGAERRAREAQQKAAAWGLINWGLFTFNAAGSAHVQVQTTGNPQAGGYKGNYIPPGEMPLAYGPLGPVGSGSGGKPRSTGPVRLPSGEPWADYQRWITGKDFEVRWQLSDGTKVHVDDLIPSGYLPKFGPN